MKVKINKKWVVYANYYNGFKFKYMPIGLKKIKCLSVIQLKGGIKINEN